MTAPLENRQVLAARWQLSEFVFLEYVKGIGVFIDVGPFPEEPNERQTDEAYEHLKSREFAFLEFGVVDWSLNLDTLREAIPELTSEELHGSISHPPAFKTSGLFSPVRLLGNYSNPHSSNCFLRIDFEFHSAPISPEEAEVLEGLKDPSFEADETDHTPPPPASWQPPKIIS